MNSREDLKGWIATVESIRHQHKELAFFTPRSVLKLHHLLRNSVDNIENIARELVFLFERDKVCLEMLCGAVKNTVAVSLLYFLMRTEWAVAFISYYAEPRGRHVKSCPALWMLPVKIFFFKPNQGVLALVKESYM